MFLFSENASVPKTEFETRVPAEYRGAYAAEGDNFNVIGTLGAMLTSVDGLNANYQKTTATLTSTQAESKTRRESLEGWTGLGESPAAVKASIKEMSDKLAANGKVNPEEIRAAVEKEFQTKLDAQVTKNINMTKTLESALIGDAANAALLEHKGNSKMLMSMITSSAAIQEQEDGSFRAIIKRPDGTVRFGADANPMTISAFVAELKTDKDLAGAFTVEAKSGAGTVQNQQKNRTPVQGAANLTPLQKISAGLAASRG